MPTFRRAGLRVLRLSSRDTLVRQLITLSLAAITLSIPSDSRAQWPSYTLFERSGSMIGIFGRSVASGKDITGDGIPDVVIGANFENQPGIGNTGAVFIYSGADNSEIGVIPGEVHDDWFGWSVALIDDLDGDGSADIVIGAPQADPGGLANAGKLYVYSGATRTPIHAFSGQHQGGKLGWSVSSLPDINSDGTDDILAGSIHADTGRAFVFSGADASLICSKAPSRQTNEFGYAVAALGDLDADGLDDFAVGSRTDSVGGAIYVYSSSLGCPMLYKIRLGGVDGLFGAAIAGCNDLDGDQVPDIVVGAPTYSSSGRVFVLSGADGGEIRNHFTAGATVLGRGVFGCDDFDGDGIPEYGAISHVGTFIWDGATGATILTNSAPASAVAVAGDWDGDRRQEIVCGHDLTYTARVLHLGFWVRAIALNDAPRDTGRYIDIEWKCRPGSAPNAGSFSVFKKDAPVLTDYSSPDDRFSEAWLEVATVPATGDSLYSALVPTNGDSNAVGEASPTSYRIRVNHASIANLHVQSAADSGYSIDNSPAPPQALTAVHLIHDVELQWDPSSSPLTESYWIYRDTTEGFVLSPSKRIGQSSQTTFVDPSLPASTLYYKVTAVDTFEVESRPSNEAVARLCVCDCHADPMCDQIIDDIQDVVATISVAFRGGALIPDPNAQCPRETTDLDCDGVTSVIDVVKVVNVAFRGGQTATEFCDPCP